MNNFHLSNNHNIIWIEPIVTKDNYKQLFSVTIQINNTLLYGTAFNNNGKLLIPIYNK
jgi:hypothetical protein